MQHIAPGGGTQLDPYLFLLDVFPSMQQPHLVPPHPPTILGGLAIIPPPF